MPKNPQIIAIVGPTATGKSDLAVFLAQQFHGEIISADSRQVYRGLDIGSGKITKNEMRGVPHHLLDVADPKRTYGVAKFQRDGRKAINAILKKGKIPIVVGGTGLYIDALLFDMKIPEVKPDAKLRKTLAKLSVPELYKKLLLLDPRRAEEIDKHNPVRLIRAIEIATHAGPVLPLQMNSPYDICWLGIRAEHETLKKRISLRLTKRIKQGMISEFIKLHKQGLSYKRMEMLGLEYRYGARLLQKIITRTEFSEQLAQEIFKYAKRQITWFKKNKQISWFDAENLESVKEHVRKFIG